MYNYVYEAQSIPKSYTNNTVTFKDATDYVRRVFAIGYV